VGGIGLVVLVMIVQLSAQTLALRSDDTAAASRSALCAGDDHRRKQQRWSPQRQQSRSSAVEELVVLITGVLKQYPMYSYTVAVVLAPGVWRSSLAILLQGGSGAAWGDVAGVAVAIVGACSVVGGSIWRHREGSILERRPTNSKRDSATILLVFKEYHPRIYKQYAVPHVLLSAYPLGFWYPPERRKTHEPLRDAVHGGVSAAVLTT
jgi:hypothetical protein